jgi:hypothetical protein
MCSHPVDPITWHHRLAPLVERIETLARLSPMLESNTEYARVLSVLMDIIHDYATRLREELNTLTHTGGEGPP